MTDQQTEPTELHVGDVVRLIDGPYAGASECVVQGIYGDTVMLDLGFVSGSFRLQNVEFNYRPEGEGEQP